MNEAPSTAEETAGNQAAAKKKKKGRGASPSYDLEERLHLLTIIKDIVPVDGDEWDEVLERHNVVYSARRRTIESIRRKFRDLYRMKMQTGNPICPDDVRLAKHARREIVNKCEITTGESDDDADDIVPSPDDTADGDDADDIVPSPDDTEDGEDADDIVPGPDDSDDGEDVSDEDNSAQFRRPNTSSDDSLSAHGVGNIGNYRVPSSAKNKRVKKQDCTETTAISDLIKFEMELRKQEREEMIRQRMQDREDLKQMFGAFLDVVKPVIQSFVSNQSNTK